MKMADKTFGVKVNEELYEKVKLMIDSSGISAKEWFEKAVSLTEMNAIKQGATDFSQDISELEVHTSRIYELVANMIQRSIYIKDHAVKEYADKLEQKEDIISEYQNKAAAATEDAKVSKEEKAALEKEKEALLKQLEEVRSVNLNNQLLIDEYKQKNDTLSGLVSKYQSFAEENEKLKDEYAKERERLKSQIQELITQTYDQQDEITKVNQQLVTLKQNQETELERLAEKKEYEKDRAVLETERNYQEKLLATNTEYNDKIRSLYEELSHVRNEYQGRIQGLELELLEARNQKQQEKE
jgi:chromosome segregation ATPase